MGQAVEPDLHICVSVCGSVWAGDTLHDFNTDRGTPGFKVHMDQEWESVTLIHATQQKNDYWTFSVKLALLWALISSTLLYADEEESYRLCTFDCT